MKRSIYHLSLGIFTVALLVGCGGNEDSKTSSETNLPSAPNNADYLGAMAQAKKQAEKVVDISSVIQAVNLFKAGEDRFPKDLQEMVTEDYLPKIPELPRGYSYAYDPNTGVVKAVKR